MRIAIDYQIFSIHKYGGISRYFFELMKQFSKMDDVSYQLGLKFSNNFYLLNNPELFNVEKDLKTDEFCQGFQFRGKAKIHKFLGRLSIVEHPLIRNMETSVNILKESNFDIFHPTYYDNYFLKHIGKKPYVLTVYDMIHELFAKKTSQHGDKTIAWKKELIEKASHIIAISQNTKDDIVELYKIDENKITVVYLGTSICLNESATTTTSAPENYILFVGNRNSYKNFNFFINAIKPLLLEDKNLFLVCAGSVSFTAEENSVIAQLGLSDKVVHFPLVDDAVMMNLYSGALCFVFPTLYEGFGIPVLEAFACGCPAILSDTSSLPEVGGDAALYFDPEDAESILETVKRVVYNTDLADNLRKKGFEQLKHFSWEKCAEQTLKVYSSVISGKK